MTTAIDTNVILDLLIPEEPFRESSKAMLNQQASKGSLIISEIVYSELAAGFLEKADLDSFLLDTGIRLMESGEAALAVAGKRWAEYSRKRTRNGLTCASCGKDLEIACPACGARLAKRTHVLADFLVAAHALSHADCLLSRDAGIYGRWFKDLKVIGSIP